MQFAFCNRYSSRRGFTLVELLVTILIIAILGALVLGVAAVAGETAREARSRTMITRLHTLLMERYGTYKSRRVKLNPVVEQAINVNGVLNTAAKKGRALAEARLYALRELILMEIPDRWSDVLLAPVPSTPIVNGYRPLPVYFNGRTDLSNVYLRRYQQLVGRINTISGSANTGGEIRRNQGAECLYMIIMLATGDGEARALFSENNIGDSDGDGAPEFLDGWGRPINFLRWAPGFDSEIQLSANELDASGTQAWQAAAISDHDPYDMFRVDPMAFRLVPLIYSAGRDEDSGLFSDPEFRTWPPAGLVNFSLQGNLQQPLIQSPQLTPFRKAPPTNLFPSQYMGTALDATATDNIHNHLIGER